MAPTITNAILSSRSSEDVIHCISSPSIPAAEVKLVLFQALNILENFKNALPYAGTWDIMGVATEVYRFVI